MATPTKLQRSQNPAFLGDHFRQMRPLPPTSILSSRCCLSSVGLRSRGRVYAQPTLNGRRRFATPASGEQMPSDDDPEQQVLAAMSKIVPPTTPPTSQSPSSPSNSPSPKPKSHQLADLLPFSQTAFSNRDLSETITEADVATTTFPHNIRTALTIRTLMAANFHLGHAAECWDKRMLPYIFGERNGIHIINLEHTLAALRRAVEVTREVAYWGGNIVFVGTKPSIHRITVQAAKRGDAYFVTQWINGTILNKERVLRRSTGYYPDQVVQLQALGSTGDSNSRKGGSNSRKGDAEVVEEPIRREVKQPYVHTPDLLIVLDYINNEYAVREANQARIPVIALCDTDCDPTRVQYPIPGNDNALTAIELVAGVLSLASREGSERRMASLNGKRESRQSIAEKMEELKKRSSSLRY
ncbi:37S ribosomal protein, mitochondrial [Borealophlyctis nickersoniae]|nr:37S ribosomal protein, mitochondrial [Borealophlyctis nickersoniae]